MAVIIATENILAQTVFGGVAYTATNIPAGLDAASRAKPFLAIAYPSQQTTADSTLGLDTAERGSAFAGLYNLGDPGIPSLMVSNTTLDMPATTAVIAMPSAQCLIAGTTTVIAQESAQCLITCTASVIGQPSGEVDVPGGSLAVWTPSVQSRIDGQCDITAQSIISGPELWPDDTDNLDVASRGLPVADITTPAYGNVTEAIYATANLDIGARGLPYAALRTARGLYLTGKATSTGTVTITAQSSVTAQPSAQCSVVAQSSVSMQPSGCCFIVTQTTITLTGTVIVALDIVAQTTVGGRPLSPYIDLGLLDVASRGGPVSRIINLQSYEDTTGLNIGSRGVPTDTLFSDTLTPLIAPMANRGQADVTATTVIVANGLATSSSAIIATTVVSAQWSAQCHIVAQSFSVIYRGINAGTGGLGYVERGHPASYIVQYLDPPFTATAGLDGANRGLPDAILSVTLLGDPEVNILAQSDTTMTGRAQINARCDILAQSSAYNITVLTPAPLTIVAQTQVSVSSVCRFTAQTFVPHLNPQVFGAGIVSQVAQSDMVGIGTTNLSLTIIAQSSVVGAVSAVSNIVSATVVVAQPQFSLNIPGGSSSTGTAHLIFVARSDIQYTPTNIWTAGLFASVTAPILATTTCGPWTATVLVIAHSDIIAVYAALDNVWFNAATGYFLYVLAMDIILPDTFIGVVAIGATVLSPASLPILAQSDTIFTGHTSVFGSVIIVAQSGAVWIATGVSLNTVDIVYALDANSTVYILDPLT